MLKDHLFQHAERLLSTARAKGVMLATAESCTGGMIAMCLTEIAGSSDVFERGFVTYSNAAKTEMLGVSSGLIREHGAVSEEVARAMAEGALSHSAADLAISVTGIAGPGGGSREKPVGLVHFALAKKTDNGAVAISHERHVFDRTNRTEVRHHAAQTAMGLLLCKI